MTTRPAPCDADDDMRWAAVMRRDRAYDGQFVTGVLSTGIYCRPSCELTFPGECNAPMLIADRCELSLLVPVPVKIGM